MKRLISLILCVLMLATCLCACGEKNNEGTGSTSNQETTPEQTTPAETDPLPSDDIMVADLNKYIIVRPEYATAAFIDEVVYLNDKIEQVFGYHLKLKDDFVKMGVASLEPTEYEIIVGDTKRDETSEYKKGLRYDDYGYTIIGKKIIIFGHSPEAEMNAIDLFIKNVISNRDASNEVLLKASDCKTVRAEYDVESVTVNGNEIKNFTVIYPKKSLMGEEELAKVLADALSAKTGYDIEAKNDKDVSYVEGAYEILVGATNRTTDTPTDLKGDESYISAKDKQIIISSGGYVGLYNAISLFREKFEEKKDNSITVTLSAPIRETIVTEIIKAMSFNVWVSSKTAERSERVLTMIRNYMPDVLGVQEASPAWMTTLKNGLSAYACVGGGRDGGSKGEHSAIFYLKDKFTLLEEGTKWLSDTPNTVSKYSESSLNRILSYAVLKRNSDGKIFVHVNTHYDHTSDTARAKQSKALVKIIADLAAKYPVVLTGDFNTTKGTDAYSTIIKAGFTNSFDIAGVKQEHGTFHGNSGKNSIIDFCFVSTGKISVTEYRVCIEKINGDYASDHHPVYIEFVY